MPRALVRRLSVATALGLGVGIGALLSTPALAVAQPGPPPTQQRWDSLRAVGESLYHLRTQWSAGRGGRSAEVTVQAFSRDFRPLGKAGRLYRGPAARAEIATRDDAFAVVLYRGGGDRPFVRVIVRQVVPPGGGVTQPPTIELARPGGTGWAPTNATLCATPEGFTVLWQEEATTPTQGRRARSFMTRISREGRVIEQPHEVPIPWGFGAIAWNGSGYHLALFYDGDSAGQTRLNLVTLTQHGAPEQHPWWISDPQAIDEVHLIPTSPGILVVYRGGADGTTIRAVHSTAVGQWGGATPPTRDLGRLEAGMPFTERVASPESIEIVSPPARPSSG
ncbi:MAG: hypothetical protein IT379_20620 [Deltaproteobacteria bacterium]|nr:hypothetical protein [Deltaproteobacteria bacterium]